MKTLQRKLGRDLWRLRYQAFTIAVLVACGVASFVAAIAASASLQASRDAFYAEAHFGDIFDHLQRAPRSVLDRLRDLPGVTAATGKVVDDFRVEVEGSAEPVTARFVSLAWPNGDQLDQVEVLQGREVEPSSTDEVMVSSAFADAWGLKPGSSIVAVINGRRARLRVVGIAVSPEYAFAMTPRTGLPDPRHFGVMWMDGTALAKATDLVGAFNDVAIQLAVGTDTQETIRRVDQVLAPYGGTGAISRKDQPSAMLVDQKIGQLTKLAHTLPVIFLGIAAFLLNVLLSRVVGTQREQMATMKALGYRTRDLERHYVAFALPICGIGVALGVALGVAGAHGMLHVYAQYFKFPAYIFRFHAWAIVGAAAFAFAAGLAGTLLAVRKAVAIPPAEAMRPEPPPTYHETFLDRLYRPLPPVVRMVLRDVQRKPGRLLLSAGSIALAASIVIAGSVMGDSIAQVLHLQFQVSHREDVTITLDRARPGRAVQDIAHIPGVVYAEGERVVPIRIHAGPRSRTTAILGLPRNMHLLHLLDANKRRLRLPAGGLSLSRALAQDLGIHAGEVIRVDVLDGKRQTLRLRVGALVDDLLGLSAYMNASDLSRLLDEARRVNVVLAEVQPQNVDSVTNRLDALPAVASVGRPSLDASLVHAQIADAFTAMSIMLSFFAAAIAVGVVYNNAHIALETRRRDLATMRILGFTRGELAGVLIGEQGIQVVVGLIPGLALGRAFGALWLSSVDHDLIRIPPTLTARSYVAAIGVVLLAAFVSALIVRRQADRLDLVAVLKARD